MIRIGIPMNNNPLITLSLYASVCIMLAPGSVAKAQAESRPVSLPPQASEIAQGIYDLGVARDVDGTVVHGFAFIHYKKDLGRQNNLRGFKAPKPSNCYAFMGSGTKWKGTPEPFVFDITSPDAGARMILIETAISTWETAAQKDILGEGSLGEVFPDQLNAPNGQNEIMFGHLDDPEVIAMTQVWGIWDGAPASRRLLEWDIVFGDDSWAWWYGAGPKPVTFTDFLAIATHEIGHAMGMDHPSDTCTEETMYAYSGWSETKKRDLNAGDIIGIQKLYP